MDIGFTGTRADMTVEQGKTVLALLRALRPEAVRHGWCHGTDARMHGLAYIVGARRELYPAVPGGTGECAICTRDVIHPLPTDLRGRSPQIARNHAIVDASDVVIATPAQRTEQPRGSGTWATMRYTVDKVGKPLITVWPDGTVTYDDWRGQ